MAIVGIISESGVFDQNRLEAATAVVGKTSKQNLQTSGQFSGYFRPSLESQPRFREGPAHLARIAAQLRSASRAFTEKVSLDTTVFHHRRIHRENPSTRFRPKNQPRRFCLDFQRDCRIKYAARKPALFLGSFCEGFFHPNPALQHPI